MKRHQDNSLNKEFNVIRTCSTEEISKIVTKPVGGKGRSFLLLERQAYNRCRNVVVEGEDRLSGETKAKRFRSSITFLFSP